MKVVSELPRAGLGNKLFPLMSGAVSSKVNQCPHFIVGMTHFSPGSWIRGERSKRLYNNYFQAERHLKPLSSYYGKKVTVPQRLCDKRIISNTLIFNETPSWKDPFICLKLHRKYIKEYLFKSLHKSVKSDIAHLKPPKIGIHIRQGDFRVLQEGEDFSKLGQVRTPIEYFIHILKEIRDAFGYPASATVYSDGHTEELSPILQMTNIQLAKPKRDILELIELSMSKIIILSAGSTFGQWAAFLSDAAIINHYQHLHSPLRDDTTNTILFEGGLIPGNKIENPLLLRNIASSK